MWLQKPPLGIGLDWSNPLNKGLVLHLAMNEGHGDKIYDLSGYGNHGTLKNFAFPPTVDSGWNPGQDGVALEFDGTNDYINCGNDESLRFNSGSQDFSVEMGAKRLSSGASHYYIDHRDANDDGWRLILGTDNRVYGSVNTLDAKSATLITDTDWHNYCFTVDRDGDGQIYLDGVADGSTIAIGGDVMDTTTALIIGKEAFASGKYVDGSIDFVRVYNRALTANEVLQRFINPYGVYL